VSSHLVLMTLFSLFVSTVFATLMQDEPREQLRLGARMFGGFMVAGLALGWILFFFPL
jgi:hypothetical protein